MLGPIIRDTSATKAAIVLYGDSDHILGTIRIRCGPDDVWLTKTRPLDPAKYYSARFVFRYLRPGTKYEYEALVHDGRVDWNKAKSGTFTTDDPERTKYTFAFGSCRYFVQLGKYLALGKDRSDMAFRSIGKLIDSGRDIQMLLQIGDQVYTDTIGLFPWLRLKSLPSLLALHKNARSTKGIRKLMSRIETKCIEDDHAYRDNGTPEMGATEPEVYQRCLDCINVFDHPNGPRAIGSPLKYGIAFNRGPFAFFLCDARYERTRTSILSEGQWDRLEHWLTSNPGIKFLVSPVPVLCQRYPDTWYGYPDDQDRLLKLIHEHKIGNLVILSGDAHASTLAEYKLYKDGEDTGLEIVEVVSSPFYAIFHDSPKDFYDEVHTPSYSLKTKAPLKVFDVDNFAVVEANSMYRSVYVEFYTKDGSHLASYYLTRSERRGRSQISTKWVSDILATL